MWDLYDELIEGIPEDIRVFNYNCGSSWTLLRTDSGTGIAMTVRSTSRNLQYTQPVKGARLKTIAACVKSWNFLEASLGQAALNAWYNTPERVQALGAAGFEEETPETPEQGNRMDAFAVYARKVTEKNVAVIGHFPYIEKRFAPICNLSILERSPQQGDFPDSACEYLLSKQDLVFITGMTLINKTLPRLLQLCNGKQVVLVGPSVPICNTLFRYGATGLSGFTVTDPELADDIIRRGGSMTLFACGKKVDLAV